MIRWPWLGSNDNNHGNNYNPKYRHPNTQSSVNDNRYNGLSIRHAFIVHLLDSSTGANTPVESAADTKPYVCHVTTVVLPPSDITIVTSDSEVVIIDILYKDNNNKVDTYLCIQIIDYNNRLLVPDVHHPIKIQCL